MVIELSRWFAGEVEPDARRIARQDVRSVMRVNRVLEKLGWATHVRWPRSADVARKLKPSNGTAAA